MKCLRGLGFLFVGLICIAMGGFVMAKNVYGQEGGASSFKSESVKLPVPKQGSGTSVEAALRVRRSYRSYKGQSLSLDSLSQLLWAAQGITDPSGARTAPSAGALYPLEIYVVAGEVEDLAEGIYHYLPAGHRLEKMSGRDVRKELREACLGQAWVEEGAAVIAVTAVYERVTGKYGGRGVRYVDMEAGHVVQNVYLQAVSLGAGTVVVGAFDDGAVTEILGLEKSEKPLCLMPVGKV